MGYPLNTTRCDDDDDEFHSDDFRRTVCVGTVCRISNGIALAGCGEWVPCSADIHIIRFNRMQSLRALCIFGEASTENAFTQSPLTTATAPAPRKHRDADAAVSRIGCASNK